MFFLPVSSAASLSAGSVAHDFFKKNLFNKLFSFPELKFYGLHAAAVCGQCCVGSFFLYECASSPPQVSCTSSPPFFPPRLWYLHSHLFHITSSFLYLCVSFYVGGRQNGEDGAADSCCIHAEASNGVHLQQVSQLLLLLSPPWIINFWRDAGRRGWQWFGWGVEAE